MSQLLQNEQMTQLAVLYDQDDCTRSKSLASEGPLAHNHKDMSAIAKRIACDEVLSCSFVHEPNSFAFLKLVPVNMYETNTFGY